MLVFPAGVKLATSTDIPFASNLPELLARINSAKIEPGYIVDRVEGKSFQNYVEANVNSQDIWALFHSLCNGLLPKEVQLIIGNIDGTTFHSKYIDREKVLELLEEFQFYLVNDCLVQFGLGSSSVETIEIFVTLTKHFQIWANREDIIEDIMRSHNLLRVDSLQFIDKFPRVTTKIEYDSGFHGYQDLLDHLMKSVSQLYYD
jgi:hypothetical protein